MTAKLLLAMALLGALAACADNAPPTTAAQADTAVCNEQADATYNANTVDEQARTSQNGLLYSATPNHVFDAEQLGAQHVRDSQFQNCEQNGNSEPDGLPGPAPVTPHIVTTP